MLRSQQPATSLDVPSIWDLTSDARRDQFMDWDILDFIGVEE